jgi:hypothetical protein
VREAQNLTTVCTTSYLHTFALVVLQLLKCALKDKMEWNLFLAVHRTFMHRRTEGKAVLHVYCVKTWRQEIAYSSFPRALYQCWQVCVCFSDFIFHEKTKCGNSNLQFTELSGLGCQGNVLFWDSIRAPCQFVFSEWNSEIFDERSDDTKDLKQRKIL